jgi:predicted metalloprotease with PDZ domain
VEDSNGDKDVNHPGIYDGGVVAAFCLDTMIQEQSAGTKSLESLLALMMTRYGLAGKKRSLDDLVADASQVAGTDLSSFFYTLSLAENIYLRNNASAMLDSTSSSRTIAAKHLFLPNVIPQSGPVAFEKN